MLILLVLHLFATPVIEGEAVVTRVPMAPLSSGALEVHAKSNNQRFAEWTSDEHSEAYDQLRKVSQTWQGRGVTNNYLIFGKTDVHHRAEKFRWEIVPYPEEGSRFGKQLAITWKVVFGAPKISRKERYKRQALFTSLLTDIDEEAPRNVPNDDPFCQQQVIQKQRILEGKYVNLLLDYAPVKGAPEFLVTTKTHKQKFSELSREEYLETMELAGRVSAHFRSIGKPYTLYFFHKTGEEAGQTVPHWHMHILAVAETGRDPQKREEGIRITAPHNQMYEPFRFLQRRSNELYNHCHDFCALVIPSRQLSDKQIKKRVAYWRTVL